MFKSFFSRCTDDETRTNDLDRDATSEKGTVSPGPPSDRSDDEGSDDDSDDSDNSDNSDNSGSHSPGPGLPTPPASTRPRMRRGATPAPARVDILDSDERSEDEIEDVEEPYEDMDNLDEDVEDNEDPEEKDSDQATEDGQNPDVRYRHRHHHPDTNNETAIVKWEPCTNGSIVKQKLDELRQQVISHATTSDLITIDDDDDEVQEIPRPAYEAPRPEQRRSTTSDMFVTPHPWETTPSSDRATVDLTGEPEMDPPLRRFSRGTTESSGLFLSQPPSETRATHSSMRDAQAAYIDLTSSPDDDGKASNDGPVYPKEEGVDNQMSVFTTLTSTQQSHSSKRTHSSSMTAATEYSGGSYKRQRTDDRLEDRTQGY